MHVEPHLIDDSGLEQRLRELTATHDTDPLSWLFFQLTHELARVLAHEMRSATNAIERAREDVGGDAFRSLPAAARGAARRFPRLPAHQHRVDRRPVVRYELLDILAEMQPV